MKTPDRTPLELRIEAPAPETPPDAEPYATGGAWIDPEDPRAPRWVFLLGAEPDAATDA
jgi:hypothetical protein